MQLRKKAGSRANNSTSRGNIITSATEPLSRREAERKILEAMPNGRWEETWLPGVLLADQICRAVSDFELIAPFESLKHGKGKLRPAGYELSVGCHYSKGGTTGVLSDDLNANTITVEPFEVVVIETYERLNLPEFMIARWNVTVGNAYRGFLWVGAGQVDPGFKGFLCCPIYNLSDKPQVLKYRDSLAVIDFVMTTPPSQQSRDYIIDFAARKRIIFDDYNADSLKSALVTHASERIKKFDSEVKEFSSTIEDLRNTVFNSVGILITAIGVIVTALTLFLGDKSPSIMSEVSPPLLLSFFAFVLSFCSIVFSLTKRKSLRVVIPSLCVLACLACVYGYLRYKSPTSSKQSLPSVSNPASPLSNAK